MGRPLEIVGGLLVLAGAFLPPATEPMIIVLLVAIVTVHLPSGLNSIKLISYDTAGAHIGQPGYETDLLYIAASSRSASGALALSPWMAISVLIGRAPRPFPV